MPVRVLTWTSPQAHSNRRGNSRPPSRIVSPLTSPRDARQTPDDGLQEQIRPEDIHRSGCISSPTPQFHSAHPRAPSKRWYLPTFGYQLEEQVHVFFRHQRHEVAVYEPPTCSVMWSLCAVPVKGLTPVPAPFPAWNRRVWPPP